MGSRSRPPGVPASGPCGCWPAFTSGSGAERRCSCSYCIAYFGLPEIGIRLGVIGSGIITLALNESAYIGVLAAAALRAVPPGQTDAAKAMGLSGWQRFRHVVFPQAFRLFLPVLGNQYNAMLKTTSLLSVISFSELVAFAQAQVSATYRPAEAFAVAALYYLALTLAWGGIQKTLEARFATVRSAGGSSPRGLLLRAGT